MLDVGREDPIQRIGLMPRETRQALWRSAGAGEAEDGLHDPQQARIDLQPIGGDAFAVAADDAAACGREEETRVGERRAAGDTGFQLGQVTGLTQQIQLEGQQRFFDLCRCQIHQRLVEPVEEIGMRIVLFE